MTVDKIKAKEVIKEEEVKKVKTSNKVKKPKKDDTIIISEIVKDEKTSKIPKRVFISIDKTFEDVIQYQSEGFSIFFPDGEGELLELNTEQRKKLNPYNAEKYRIAEAITNNSLDLSSIKTSHMKFKPKAAYSSATNRLRVENKNPRFHYAWKRQDELQQVIYEGGRICTDPKVKTFGSFDEHGEAVGEKNSTHYVKANGEIELVLTETPIEVYQANRDAIDAKSVRQNEAVDNTAKAELRAMGGDPDAVERRFKG